MRPRRAWRHEPAVWPVPFEAPPKISRAQGRVGRRGRGACPEGFIQGLHRQERHSPSHAGTYGRGGNVLELGIVSPALSGNPRGKTWGGTKPAPQFL
jgi:hypothetical protein